MFSEREKNRFPVLYKHIRARQQRGVLIFITCKSREVENAVTQLLQKEFQEEYHLEFMPFTKTNSIPLGHFFGLDLDFEKTLGIFHRFPFKDSFDGLQEELATLSQAVNLQRELIPSKKLKCIFLCPPELEDHLALKASDFYQFRNFSLALENDSFPLPSVSSRSIQSNDLTSIREQQRALFLEEKESILYNRTVVKSSPLIILFEEVGQSLLQSFQGQLKNEKQTWDNFSKRSGFTFAAEKYELRMKKLHGKIQILGMPSPIPLEQIFTHVNLLEQPSTFLKLGKETLLKMYLGKVDSYGEIAKKKMEGSQAVQQFSRLFVLGKPGTGKSTFLKSLVMQAITGKLKKIPILIPLRELTSKKLSIWEYLHQEFQACDFPQIEPFVQEMLEQGKAVIFCDGLDEVNREEGGRKQVIQEIERFAQKYSQCQFIITCRVAAKEYRFSNFHYAEIANFDDQQIKVFVNNWFSKEKATADLFLEQFEQKEQQGLQDLANIPLLLTLLCITFDELLSFPKRRSEIYEEALDTLLKKWDISRGIKRDETYKKLSLPRKRQLFAKIAIETFEQEEYFLEKSELGQKIVSYLQNIPPQEKQDNLDGETILETIEAQHGIFVEREQRLYSFSHLTFQEYYTAKYIVGHVQKHALEHLIQNHLYKKRWREVFLLTAELLEDSSLFFELFLRKINHNPTKLPQLWKSLAPLGNQFSEEILQKRLISLIQFLVINNLKWLLHGSSHNFIHPFLEILTTCVQWLNALHLEASDTSATITASAFASVFASVSAFASSDDFPTLTLEEILENKIGKRIDFLTLAVKEEDLREEEQVYFDSLFYFALLCGMQALFYCDQEKNSKEELQKLFEQFQNCLNVALKWVKTRIEKETEAQSIRDKHFEKAQKNRLEKKNLVDLDKIFRECSLLTVESPTEFWREKIEKIQKVLREMLPLKEYELDESQIKSFQQYIEGNFLLWECLQNAAYCPEWEKIEDSLLRPPLSFDD